jgi:MFS family permease
MPYFVEFQPKDYRGRMITLLASFFLVGNVITALLALAIIPSVDLFYYPSWRVFVASCGIPSTLAGVLILFFPESPRYLAARGRTAEALKVVEEVWSTNRSRSCRKFLLTSEQVASAPREFSISEIASSRDADADENRCSPQLTRSRLGFSGVLRRAAAQTKRLTSGAFSRNFWILFVIHFSIAFG